MKTSNAVVGLSALIAVLALVAAGTGLFYGDGGSPFAFTSVRGQPVEIYGQGLYRYDTLFQTLQALLPFAGDLCRANTQEGDFAAVRSRAQRLLNAVQRPEIYEEVLIEPSGAPIALSIWKGKSGAPCVVFLPGTMTHPLFYEEFLDRLAQAGFNVVGVHYTEHGKSPRVKRLFSFEDLVQNGLDAVGYASERFMRKVLVLGSSQGAIVAMALAKDERVGAVFAHNVLDTRLPQSLRVTRFPPMLQPLYPAIPKAMRGVARVLPRLPLPISFYLQEGRIFGAEWTREQFHWDPLSLRSYPLYFLASLFSADTSFLDSGEIRCPVVVIASTGDKLFPLDYTEQVYERIVAPIKEMLVFELNHHLIFNECLEEVLPSLVTKLEEYGARHEGNPP